jgi:UDP-glucose 4-epimerase
MKILVTGGAGYIGSHTLMELVGAGHTPIVVDNLCNSSKESVRRVEKLTNTAIPLNVFDIRDSEKLASLFAKESFDAVIHFAGLKAVGESVKDPLLYYDSNVVSSVKLLEVMAAHGVQGLVFSSSATVYGDAPSPYKETQPTGIGITNPYGRSKYMIEQILRDTAAASPLNKFIALRYFNPVGAHPSGKIGEDPSGVPNNLMPFIAQTAVGKREKLSIFGNDYDTVDGTGVRDYIHVVDLAKGHVAALENLHPGFDAINLGSGEGTSVLQLLRAFEKACGKTIPYEFVARRPGDLPEYYANVDKAGRLLHWQTEKTIADICTDAWRWQSQNPNGYMSGAAD